MNRATRSGPQEGDGRPALREVSDHIERRMHGKTGSVTLHYKNGRLERVQYGDYEDARAMPWRGDGR